MPRAARGRAARPTRSPATFSLDGHLIETYNHIDDLPQHSSLPKKRPRHATRGATAAERRADRQAAAALEPQPNGMVTRSSRQNLLRTPNSVSPLTAPSPSSEPIDSEYPPISCRVCFKSNTPTKIVCCSICRKGVHTFCLNPPVMDLPDDASWKCSKCRRTRLPLKKEARIILRDALNTYSSLCTDKYINAVANVVCVVSDSESPQNKRQQRPTSKPKPETRHKPSHPPPNDNTVVLRLSTDDSDLDSNVDDDIQPNPAASSDKPRPSRPTDSNDSKRQASSAKDPSSPQKQSSPATKKFTKEEKTPSSASSREGDDERPLSQLKSRGAHRRHRHGKSHKSKHVDPALASPKMRLKAKQRRMREENPDRVQSPSIDPKIARDPFNLPPKRRGRKPGSKKTNPEKSVFESQAQMEGDPEKDASIKKGDQTNQVETNAQLVKKVSVETAEPTIKDVKEDFIKEEITEPLPVTNNEHFKKKSDMHSELSDESAFNIDEGYPGDTEDDLPLSKRSARYRKPLSQGSNKMRSDKPSSKSSKGVDESKESSPPAQSFVNDEGSREPKQEAFIQETAGSSENHTAEALNPDSKAQEEQTPAIPVDNVEPNPDQEKQSSGSWPQMKLDPKHEALFALARVQRQQPKPSDSPEHQVISVEPESCPAAPKQTSRPKNIPESERQRIEVTALAASNMRRNVSNMASTMAGLRPHSPRISKGSINLLLQQNQPEVHSEIATQRAYPPSQDISIPRHVGHPNREDVVQSAAGPHRSNKDIGSNPSPAYRRADPRSQETPRNPSALQFTNAPSSVELEPYGLPQRRNVVQSGNFVIAEPEVSSFAKRNRQDDILPQPKRQRSNKSDLSNVLSTDNRIPTLFPETTQRTSQHPPVLQSTVQVQSSSRQTQPSQTQPSQPGTPYMLAHRGSQSHFEPPPVHPTFRDSHPGMRERLTLPEARMTPNVEPTLSTRYPSTGVSYPSHPLRNSATQAEPSLQRTREEETRRVNQRAYENPSIPPVQDSGLRTSPQTYPSPNVGGDLLSSRLHWTESNNHGVNALRRDYTGTSMANQSWSESQVGHRPVQQEGSYNATAGRFVPIDRRTRRPMPYVPTATRKAQFEQGRALAFIDSRPVPQSTEPSDAYHLEDRSPAVTPKPYAGRPEGSYSGPEYTFPQSGRNRTTYPEVDNRTSTNSYQGDYYVQRKEYGRSANPERVNEHSAFMTDSQRDPLRHDRVGNDARTPDRTVFGQNRLGVHQRVQQSSGPVLEPPLAGNKSLSIERNEAPPFSTLVGRHARSYPENDLPRIANTFESGRRLPEKRGRFAIEAGHSERVYGTDCLQTADHRIQGYSDSTYGSYPPRRNDAMQAPTGSVVGTRLPGPMHASTDHYRSRETTVGPTERSFPPSMVGPSGSGTLYNRHADQNSSHYNYGRSNAEARNNIIPQRMTALGGRNDDFGADRVSNIPLVARFDNSLGGYMDGKHAGRSSDRGSRVPERQMTQRNEQGQQLPSLRSNPSLRDLLS